MNASSRASGERGSAVLSAVDAGGARQALRDRLGEIAPDFARLTVEIPYGEFWSRPGLDLATRELVTIAALCALGRERQLAGHLRSALGLGVNRAQLVETLMHMAIYAGWPAAVNGLLVARDVFSAHTESGAHGIHRFDVGATGVTVVSDGHADLPAALFAGGVGLDRVERFLAGQDLRTESVRVALNGLLLEHGGRVIVVDPGLGQPTARTRTGWFPRRRDGFCATSSAPACLPPTSSWWSSRMPTTITRAPSSAPTAS